MQRTGVKRYVHHRLRSRLPASLESADNRGDRYHYAGFWLRFWAFLIDLMIVSAAGRVIITLSEFVITIDHPLFETVVSAGLFFVYFAWMTKKYQQTVGKMVLGIKVISKDGELTWGQVFFREGVGRLLHQAFSILYLLYIVVAFTSKKEGIHDIIADTYVVHESLKVEA